MSLAITFVPGDCPELGPPVKQVLEATGVAIDWHEPEATVEDIAASVRATGVALLGWQQGGREDRETPPTVALRRALEVYAQERPIADLAGIPSRFTGVDLVVVRETTEDVYAQLEHETIPQVYESVKVTTRAACERIARHACELATRTGRKKLTIVHKANIMKLSDGLFLRTCREVASEYDGLEVEDVIVDALCMRVVLDPTRFDVLVCGNLFGDIVSDLCAGLVGGPSNAPSVNRSAAGTLFTAGHGDPPEVSGTGRANPLPLLLSAVHLLADQGHADAAAALKQAVAGVLSRGLQPYALGGEVGPEAFCAAVAEAMA